ncbi:MAG: hypothetical protein A3G40_11410 [Deltaproteobacteria bacterium RIFCSPLOWO2_12_FULL_57_22]|nr:MAG: hypothetical protein A3G40_11410 [Deltaproteobacteria bacterium RIFCSPLOWO2_12_FULL_57_22]
MINLEAIQAKTTKGSYVVSFTHTEKLRQRRVKAEDIERAIQEGSIIEEYPDDPRGPSCLIFGFSRTRPLHVLCGRLEEPEILIITAYEPDPVEWEDDWKTRKKR